MTILLTKYLESEALSQPILVLAQQVKVNENTVRNVLVDALPLLDSAHQLETPRVLGIDEVHTRRNYHLVLTNVTEGTVIGMLKNRNLTSVDSYFSTLRDRARVHVVTMNMLRGYGDSVRRYLSNATIVIDRSHVLRIANQSLETVRKTLCQGLPRKERIQMKNDRFLMSRRAFELNDIQRQQLRRILAKFPKLAAARRAKETSLYIYLAHSRQEAENKYTEWRSSPPLEIVKAFGPLLKAISNWHNEIFSYSHYRYTNALTEPMNALTKAINRLDKGYSFEILRARMLYAPSAHISRSTSIRTTQWR